MRWLKPKRTEAWIVAKTTAHGFPLAYFQWNYKSVWRWTKTIDKACVFRTEQQAIQAVRSTSADWQDRWRTVRLTT